MFAMMKFYYCCDVAEEQGSRWIYLGTLKTRIIWNKIFPANSVIIAIYAAPTVGRLGILSTDACFNQACCGFIPKEDIISKEYLFLTLLSLRNQLNVQAVGACQKNLSVGFMNMLEVLVPKASVMRKWTDYVQLLYTQMLSIDRQISMLTKQRDELLPLLMNGQVSVNSDLSVYK